jgi:hypothetical protein
MKSQVGRRGRAWASIAGGGVSWVWFGGRVGASAGGDAVSDVRFAASSALSRARTSWIGSLPLPDPAAGTAGWD